MDKIIYTHFSSISISIIYKTLFVCKLSHIMAGTLESHLAGTLIDNSSQYTNVPNKKEVDTAELVLKTSLKGVLHVVSHSDLAALD